MNKIQKLLTLLAIAGISNGIMAYYEYDLVNMIGDTIVVKINQERADNKDDYQIIPPGKTVKQVYDNAYCLRKLAWAPWDKDAPLNGGMDLVDKTTGRIPAAKQRQFGDEIAYNYAFIPMKIIMQPNEVFQQTRKAAAQLLQGIDAFACQTITEVKSFMTGGMGGGGMPGGTTGGSTTPTASKTTQLINLLENLHKIIEPIKLDTATNLEKAKAKDAISSLLTSENIKLLKDPGRIPVLEISKIRDAMTNKTNQDIALGIIDSTLHTITLVPTKIDTTSSVVKTSIDMMASGGMGGYGMGGSTGMTSDRSKCDFGLGTIGKGSGKLAGYTLCKSREFIIYYEVDNDGLPVMDKYGRPSLTATTVEGQ